jgi:hypothetical protein
MLDAVVQSPCANCISCMPFAQLLSKRPLHIWASHSRRSLLLPCASCVPSWQALRLAGLVAPLSPRAGPYFFPFTCTIRMADMPLAALSTSAIEFILTMLLRRAPYPPPSDPASQHRAAIVSSSLDQGSPAERISSSLALCLYFGFGFGPVIGPVFGWGLFFRPTASPATQSKPGTPSS